MVRRSERSTWLGYGSAGNAAARAGVRFVRVLTGEDFGDGPWAGIHPLATIADVGALLDVIDRL